MNDYNEETKLDDITRHHLRKHEDANNVIFIAFVLGFLLGMAVTSYTIWEFLV